MISTSSQDPLSCVVRGLELRAAMWRLTPRSPWAVRLSGSASALCFVCAGQCWIDLPDRPRGECLVAGDLAVITRPDGCVLRDQSGAPAVAIEAACRQPPPAPVPAVAAPAALDPAATCLVGGQVSWEDAAAPVLAGLPPLLVLRHDHPLVAHWLGDALRQASEELQGGQNGASAVANNLAQVTMLYALRAHLETEGPGAGQALAGLMDPSIGPVLARMHLRPGRAWTLLEMAAEAKMSRSSFAARFAEVVGTPPMNYLFECRMRQACRLLRSGRHGLKHVADSVGYGSAAAFSVAFKRWSGRSPGAYRRGAGERRAAYSP